MHPLKMGGDRDSKDAECSNCGILVNHPANLLATKRYCGCHQAFDEARRAVANNTETSVEMAREWRLCWNNLYRSDEWRQEMARWE